jgi:hypothetical protein
MAAEIRKGIARKENQSNKKISACNTLLLVCCSFFGLNFVFFDQLKSFGVPTPPRTLVVTVYSGTTVNLAWNYSLDVGDGTL